MSKPVTKENDGEVRAPHMAPGASSSNSVSGAETEVKTIQNRSEIYVNHKLTMNAIRIGDYDTFVKELERDLNRLNDHIEDGWYGGHNHLLHVASYFNRIKIATKLLDVGAELECRTSFGYTPLMIACVNGYLDMAVFLLDRGASLDLVENNNRSCMDLCHSDIRAGIDEALRPKTPEPEILPEEVVMTDEERIADERRRIKLKFDEADVDGSGELDAEELADFCESLGTKLTPEELEAALLILDESGDGQISYEEFAEWWLDD
jgi:hypothetical protein